MILSIPYRPGKFVVGDYVTECGADLYVVKEIDADGDEVSVACIKPPPKNIGRFTVSKDETLCESKMRFHRVKGGLSLHPSFASAFHEPTLFPLDRDSEIELLRVRERTGIDLRYLDWSENVGFDGSTSVAKDGRFVVSDFWHSALMVLRRALFEVSVDWEKAHDIWDTAFDYGGYGAFLSKEFFVINYDDSDWAPYNFRWRDVEIKWLERPGWEMTSNIALAPEMAAQMLADCLPAIIRLLRPYPRPADCGPGIEPHIVGLDVFWEWVKDPRRDAFMAAS